MKKPISILGINGSPRAANTDIVLAAALKAAEETGAATTREIRLRDEKIEYCIGCFACNRDNMSTSGCPPFRDSMDTIVPALQACDVLLLASPVYFGSVTAPVKTFMDRTEPLLRYAPAPRRSALRNVVGGGIAVGGNRNGGQETTLQSIHNFFLIHDMIVVGTGPDPQPGAYLGVAAFSGADPERGSQVRDAVERDPLGLRAARILGTRAVEAALLLKNGTTNEQNNR